MWLNSDSFLNLIIDHWNNSKCQLYGTGMINLWQKLKFLKPILKSWNFNQFGNIFKNITKPELEVIHLENNLASNPIAKNKRNLNCAKNNLLYLQECEEMY